VINADDVSITNLIYATGECGDPAPGRRHPDGGAMTAPARGAR
jgi:hypothetical protein